MTVNIFNYIDYRDYLKAYYSANKRSNSKFSYQYFSKRAGVKSPNFLCLIINGERNLSHENIVGFAKAIGMGREERNYFEALVLFNQAKTSEAKRYYLGLLSGLKKGRPGTELTAEQYEYLSNWYYPVIRELVTVPDFSEEPEWIAKRLRNKIGVKQVREALETLLKLGLLKRDEAGRLAQAETCLTTGDDVAQTASYQFHKQMLGLAQEILESVSGREREISSVTAAVSKEQYREIKNMIREFRNKVVNYINDTQATPDEVFQINLQMLPMTAIERKKNI